MMSFANGAMVENHDLVGAQGHHGVGATVVVAELDFEDSRSELLDDGADLATHEATIREILQESHDVEYFDAAMHGRPHKM